MAAKQRRGAISWSRWAAYLGQKVCVGSNALQTAQCLRQNRGSVSAEDPCWEQGFGLLDTGAGNASVPHSNAAIQENISTNRSISQHLATTVVSRFGEHPVSLAPASVCFHRHERSRRERLSLEEHSWDCVPGKAASLGRWLVVEEFDVVEEVQVEFQVVKVPFV